MTYRQINNKNSAQPYKFCVTHTFAYSAMQENRHFQAAVYTFTLTIHYGTFNYFEIEFIKDDKLAKMRVFIGLHHQLLQCFY